MIPITKKKTMTKQHSTTKMGNYHRQKTQQHTIDDKIVTLSHGTPYIYIFEHTDTIPQFAWVKIGGSRDICNRLMNYSQISWSSKLHRCYHVKTDTLSLSKIEHRLHDQLMLTTSLTRKDEKFMYGGVMSIDELLTVCDLIMKEYIVSEDDVSV